jgi:hypothetical protein
MVINKQSIGNLLDENNFSVYTPAEALRLVEYARVHMPDDQLQELHVLRRIKGGHVCAKCPKSTFEAVIAFMVSTSPPTHE